MHAEFIHFQSNLNITLMIDVDRQFNELVNFHLLY